MLDHSCQVQRHALAERGDDLYETPSVATEALLRVETVPRVIWEPACGRGAITHVLEQAGRFVFSTDLCNYGVGKAGIDFLMERELPDPSVQAIVTNPPYKLAEAFVAKALELCPIVIMLLRLAFLESERRRHILDTGTLARVHCFRRRLPMMHRDGWEGRKANSGMVFAWFVWDRQHRGPTMLHRLSWDKS